MSRAETVESKPGRRRAGAIALWTLQIAAAAMLINAATAKFAGNEQYAADFATFGLGDWFIHLVGVLELLGGLGLLLPQLVGLAAVALTVMLAGAVISELMVINGNPAPAVSLLLVVALIAWFRRASIANLIKVAR